MSRVDFSKDDIIGDFLPNVGIRRITLESASEEDMAVMVDLVIDDVLDEDIKNATAKAVDEDLTVVRRQMGRGRHARNIVVGSKSSMSVIDEALKVCVVVATSEAANIVIKRLFSRRGQVANFQDRLRQITSRGLEYLESSIAQAMQGLANRRQDIFFFQDGAKPTGAEQYYAAAADHLKEYDVNGNEVHKLYKTFSLPEIGNNINSLHIYAFTFMDFNIFDLEMDPSEMTFLNNMYGKLSYNKVIENGSLNPHSMVLLDSRGTPWSGPYHVMQDGSYMKGRFHEADAGDPEQYLTSIMVPNIKVQDFRRFQRSEKDMYLPKTLPSFLQENKRTKYLDDIRANQFNARAEIDHDPITGHVSLEFLVDQEQIFVNNSKYGHLYSNLPNRSKYKIMRSRDYFRLTNLKIVRRRMTKRDLGVNRLGFGAKDVFDRETPEFIVVQSGERPSTAYRASTFDTNDLLVPRESSNGSVSDEPFGTLAWEVYGHLTTWFQNSPRTPLPIANDGMPPFPFYRNFIGTDESLDSVYDGVYQYGIELSYEDGLEKYLQEILIVLRDQTKQLERYYNECSIPVTTSKYFSRSGLSSPTSDELYPDYREKNVERTESRGNYNHITRTFDPAFVNSARQRYSFVEMARAYFEAVNVVYADAIFRIGNLNPSDSPRLSGFNLDNVVALLRPENSRPEQILEILRSFQELHGLLEDILDIDLIKDASNVRLTPSEAGSAGRNPRIMRVKKWFSEADDFVSADLRYLPVAAPGIFDLIGKATQISAVDDASVFGTDLVGNTGIRDLGPDVGDLAADVELLDQFTGPGPVEYEMEDRTAVTTEKVRLAAGGKNYRGRRRRRGSHRVTSEQVKEMWFLEEDKFGIDAESDGKKFNNAPAAFTMNSYKMGKNQPTFTFGTGTENGAEEDFIIQYEKKSSRRGARGRKRRSSGISGKQLDIIDKHVEYTLINKKKNDSGNSNFSSWRTGPPKPMKNKGISAAVNQSILDKMEKKLNIELVTENNGAYFVRNLDEIMESNKRSLADKIQDSMKVLCDAVAIEDKNLIEFIPDFSPESAPEFEITDRAVIITEMVRKASVAMSDKSEMESRQIRIPKIEKILSNKPSVLKTDEEKNTFNPPVQIKKLADGIKPIGATNFKASNTLFGTVQKIKKLDGFTKDASGKPILSAPKYRDVKVSEVKAGLPPGKYKLETFEDSKLGIEKPPVSTGKKFFTVEKPTNIESKSKKKIPKAKSNFEQIEKTARDMAPSGIKSKSGQVIKTGSKIRASKTPIANKKKGRKGKVKLGKSTPPSPFKSSRAAPAITGRAVAPLRAAPAGVPAMSPMSLPSPGGGGKGY